MAESLLSDRSGIIASALEPEEVRRIWREHLDESRDHSVFLWGLMMLGLWDKTNGVVARPH
jgi:asparagine synthase (glutamine-hydrolysing)